MQTLIERTRTLPALRQSVDAFTLTPLTVFLHSGRECIVKAVKPVLDSSGNQSAAVVLTTCGKTLTFRRNSPRVQIVL